MRGMPCVVRERRLEFAMEGIISFFDLVLGGILPAPSLNAFLQVPRKT